MNSWQSWRQTYKGLKQALLNPFTDPPDPTRRAFLKGFGATVAAALIAPALPVFAEVCPEYKLVSGSVEWAFDVRYDLVGQMQGRAAQEIMEMEDARIMELLLAAADTGKPLSYQRYSQGLDPRGTEALVRPGGVLA